MKIGEAYAALLDATKKAVALLDEIDAPSESVARARETLAVAYAAAPMPKEPKTSAKEWQARAETAEKDLAALRIEHERETTRKLEVEPPPAEPAALDEAGLESICPVKAEDDDGTKAWPGGAVGALCETLLHIASEFGQHTMAVDAHVWAARDEQRRMATEIRSLRGVLGLLLTQTPHSVLDGDIGKRALAAVGRTR